MPPPSQITTAVQMGHIVIKISDGLASLPQDLITEGMCSSRGLKEGYKVELNV